MRPEAASVGRTFRAAVIGMAGTARIVVVAAIVAAVCFTPAAQGQTEFRVNSRNVAGYCQLLGLETELTEIARALFGLYMLDIEGVEQQRRAAMEEIIARAKAAQSREGMKERLAEVAREYETQSARVEAAFFADLRVTLNEEQAPRWPKVERLRRRETILRSGWLSGENVDLIAMTGRVGADRDLGPEVASALEKYELQLDRALVTRAREMAQLRESWENPRRPLSESDLAEMGETKREVGLRVRDLNRRHARVIEALMPADLMPAFHEELLRRSYPRVYGESHVDRMLLATNGFDDLTSEQRTSLDEFRATYARERKAADEAWSSAITGREEDGEVAAKSGRRNESESRDPLVRARLARHDLDERFGGRIEAVLSPAQRRRLPTVEEEKKAAAGKR